MHWTPSERVLIFAFSGETSSSRGSSSRRTEATGIATYSRADATGEATRRSAGSAEGAVANSRQRNCFLPSERVSKHAARSSQNSADHHCGHQKPLFQSSASSVFFYFREEGAEQTRRERKLLSSVVYELGFRYHKLRAFCMQLQQEHQALIMR